MAAVGTPPSVSARAAARPMRPMQAFLAQRRCARAAPMSQVRAQDVEASPNASGGGGASAAAEAVATAAAPTPKPKRHRETTSTPAKSHNFDTRLERAAAVDAAREAFRSTREAALEKNASLAAALKNKLVLAPLTRGGNLPFRRLCADFGAEATVSEMVFARSLVGRGGGGKGASYAEKTRLRHADNEAFFGVQIATNEIREGSAALRLAAENGASWASLNCGCPIYEATRRGLGASLLKKPTKLARLVSGLVAESPLPLEVKIRTGPGESNVNASFVAALLEAAGAAAVTIHGRTMEQRYRKPADWEMIERVAAERRADADVTGLPPVPIIGNGDFLTWYEVERRGIYLGGRGEGESDEGGDSDGASFDASSGVHAAMIGRGALVKPWIWQECRERRELDLSAAERVAIYRQLVAHMKDYFGDDDKGRAKAFYFLPWHFNFLHRYRPYPIESYGETSLKQPLLSTRVTIWDAGKEEEGAEGVPALERLLRCENEGAYELIAGVLWDSGSDGEAVAGLERLSAERVRDWERELYDKAQAEGSSRGGGRRGGRDEEGQEEDEDAEEPEVSG